MAKKEKKVKKTKEAKKVNQRKQLAEAKRYIRENKNKVVKLTGNSSGDKTATAPQVQTDSGTTDCFTTKFVVSVVLLVLVLFLFSQYAPPRQVADYVSLIFVVIAHFLATAVIINVLPQKSNQFFVVANVVASLTYWGATIFVTILVHAMEMAAVGTVIFAQLVVLGVAAVIVAAVFSFCKCNSDKKEEPVQQETTATL